MLWKGDLPVMSTSILKLFIEFLQIGLFSIGGGYAVIPLIKSHVVDLSGWLTLRQFTDIITISQMTPGPLAVNTSTFVGLRIGGLPGAVAATLGCVCSGFLISLLLCRFFERFSSSATAVRILKGLKAASLGLIVSAAASILVLAFSMSGGSPVRIPLAVSGINLCAVFLFLAALIAIRRFRLNPMFVMVLSGIAGLLLYR